MTAVLKNIVKVLASLLTEVDKSKYAVISEGHSVEWDNSHSDSHNLASDYKAVKSDLKKSVSAHVSKN